ARRRSGRPLDRSWTGAGQDRTTREVGGDRGPDRHHRAAAADPPADPAVPAGRRGARDGAGRPGRRAGRVHLRRRHGRPLPHARQAPRPLLPLAGSVDRPPLGQHAGPDGGAGPVRLPGRRRRAVRTDRAALAAVRLPKPVRELVPGVPARPPVGPAPRAGDLAGGHHLAGRPLWAKARSGVPAPRRRGAAVGLDQAEPVGRL
ncbi:MAG: hypothetical protein AVDCRST_MAG33-2274, partial [uncultured Thermomicrobiales bacterium]